MYLNINQYSLYLNPRYNFLTMTVCSPSNETCSLNEVMLSLLSVMKIFTIFRGRICIVLMNLNYWFIINAVFKASII